MIRRFAQPEVLSEAEGTSNAAMSRRRNNVTIAISHRFAKQLNNEPKAEQCNNSNKSSLRETIVQS